VCSGSTRGGSGGRVKGGEGWAVGIVRLFSLFLSGLIACWGRVGKRSEHFRRQEGASSVKTDEENKRVGRGRCCKPSLN
jgi:hypothetical protein